MTTVEYSGQSAISREARQRDRQRRLWNLLARVMLYALLIGVSLWYMAPLFWMFMSSFMPLEQVGIFPPGMDSATVAVPQLHRRAGLLGFRQQS